MFLWFSMIGWKKWNVIMRGHYWFRIENLFIHHRKIVSPNQASENIIFIVRNSVIIILLLIIQMWIHILFGKMLMLSEKTKCVDVSLLRFLTILVFFWKQIWLLKLQLIASVNLLLRQKMKLLLLMTMKAPRCADDTSFRCLKLVPSSSLDYCPHLPHSI